MHMFSRNVNAFVHYVFVCTFNVFFQVTGILSDNGYTVSSSSSQLFSSFNTLLILLTVSNDTNNDTAISDILEDVSFSVKFVTVFLPACE